MLAIAIISLAGFFLGIVTDLLDKSNDKTYPDARAGLGAIMTISWWDICFPAAICFMIVAAVWVCLIIMLRTYDK